jgi:hypothetical protein
MWDVTDVAWSLFKSAWVWGTLGLALWLAAWLYYLRTMIRTRWLEVRPHRWGVDLETGKVTFGKRPVV